MINIIVFFYKLIYFIGYKINLNNHAQQITNIIFLKLVISLYIFTSITKLLNYMINKIK